MSRLLKKGIEIEMFAGTQSGDVLPLSGKLKAHFKDFSQEPDERNFEFITKPTNYYEDIFNQIIIQRIKIREFLKDLNNLTLIPGSTIPLNYEKSFYPSKQGDPYHDFILKNYKHRVITTGLHINIGMSDYKKLFKVLCALRLDMPLFLALSASSCFHDGKVTNYKSFRWHNFPHTPEFVPFFVDHEYYVNWTNKQLASKNMLNVRHLWTGIRPNGPDRPDELNRIEIRICDFVSDIKKSLAVVALIETLIQNYLINENWPEILENRNEADLNDLVKILNEQEELVALDGLNAKIWDWRNDTEKEAFKVIEFLYKDLRKVANDLNITNYLENILDILKEGNEATKFLNMYNETGSVHKTIQHFVQEFNIMDLKYHEEIKAAIK